CDWHTQDYANGTYPIVVEVADQTDLSWSNPETRTVSYSLEGARLPANHAPERPTPTSPYDWYVYYSGSTAQLCAQDNGDPDGDSIAGYYFDIFDSAERWNSGWVSGNCVTTGALGPYNYQWRVKVRDGSGAESAWSEAWHFTLVNPVLSVTELYFEPLDANSEQVRIRACTSGLGGVGITMRVSVNDASDGSGNGTWRVIKELGVPCFNEIDAPVWHTLRYGDGKHRVRVEARGNTASWNGAAVREATYTVPHRRPAYPDLLAPINPVNWSEVVWVADRTVTLRWQSGALPGSEERTGQYRLRVSTNPDPAVAPLLDTTLSGGTSEHTVTFGDDYAHLYWNVTAINDRGSTTSDKGHFGIDRTPPSAGVQALPATSHETVFTVRWNGTDDRSGVRWYDVQVRDGLRGEWTDWLLESTKTFALFTGLSGHQYYFRARAADVAGNWQSFGDSQATLLVDPGSRPQEVWWDPSYSSKRTLIVLNNESRTLLDGYPVHLHLDANTQPTAAEMYSASLSPSKCDDFAIVFNNGVSFSNVNRIVRSCSPTAIDVWFRTVGDIPAASTGTTAYYLYYGNPSALPAEDPSMVWYPTVDAYPLRQYYMHEGSGSTLYDASGHYNGTISSELSWSPDGKFGPALVFPGDEDPEPRPAVYAGTGAQPASAFTVEVWLKRTKHYGGIIARQETGGAEPWRWSFMFQGDKLNFDVEGSGGVEHTRAFDAATYFDSFHHYAVTFNGASEVRFYVDGKLDGTYTLPGSGLNPAAAPLHIGANAIENQRVGALMSGFTLSNGARSAFPYGRYGLITQEPTLALGSALQYTTPVTGTPDLAVESVAVYPSSLTEGGYIVAATVTNQGDATTGSGFYTDLYVDHVPSQAGDYTGSVHYWVASPIEPGQAVTLTAELPTLPGGSDASLTALSEASEITKTMYVQTDSSGVIDEPDEQNNLSPGAPVCIAAGDPYEPDDSHVQATGLPLGAPQAHTLHAVRDEDWFSFSAIRGRTYTIVTTELGLAADTYLYLYGDDATTLIAINDDHDNSLASHLEWTAPADGVYYVAVRHWNPGAGGCANGYTILLSEGGSRDG
ncbi:MAG: hypothetical protein GX601_04375, partial [Anaerolineales bacterium]|nr:hypothetical protein [Anaerolineales bacterium]